MYRLWNVSKLDVLALVFFAIFFFLFFGPAVFSDRSLAIADGSAFYHPFLVEPFTLWQHDQLGGYPAYADPQVALWYPLRWLAPSYDLFIVSAYIVGAYGAFRLARNYGCNVQASLAAGFVFSLSGFMTSHLGHATIIHSAAWLPLMVLATERAGDRIRPMWIAVGALATGCALLAGHPQIAIYSIGLCIVLMSWNFIVGVREGLLPSIQRLGSYAAILGIGLALAWVQIGPTLAFAEETLRAQLSYFDFHTFSLPSEQLPMLVFPHLFGYQAADAPLYFGEYVYVEVVPYVGMASAIIIVCSIPFVKHPKRAFWILVAFSAVLYALAEETFVGELAYGTPVLNDFRAPARTIIVLALAASILVALSLDALSKRTAIRSNRLVNFVLPVGATAAALAIAVAVYPFVESKAVEKGLVAIPFFKNPAVLVPLVFAFAAALGIARIVTRPKLGFGLLCGLLVSELTWTGYKAEWVLAQPLAKVADIDSSMMIADVKANHGRILSMSGADTRMRALAPNSNLEFDVPHAGSYGPLLPTDFANLTGMDTVGRFSARKLNRSVLQALGVSHIVFNDQIYTEILFNSNCAETTTARQIDIQLPQPISGTHLRITSSMSCSVGVPQAQPVLEIIPQTRENILKPLFLRAGIDTAEWAIKREDVAPIVLHNIPARTSVLPGTDGIGILSLTDLPLEPNAQEVDLQSLRLNFLLDNGAVSIQQIDVIDASSGTTTPIPLTFSSQWPKGALEIVGFTESADTLTKFTPTLGYAWLVGEIVPLAKADSAKTIATERLPDGRLLDLAAIGLVTTDESAPPAVSAGSAPGKAALLDRARGKISLATVTDAPKLLVVSERFHSGWRAEVNGAPATVYRTNSEFMGVQVPSGKSLVAFKFQPSDLFNAAKVSVLAALILIVMISLDVIPAIKNYNTDRVMARERKGVADSIRAGK